MNNAKHFIKRQSAPDAHKRYGDMHKPDKMPLFKTKKDEQYNRLHRAASTLLNQVKRGEITQAAIYDLENAL